MVGLQRRSAWIPGDSRCPHPVLPAGAAASRRRGQCDRGQIHDWHRRECLVMSRVDNSSSSILHDKDDDDDDEDHDNDG